MEIVFQTEIVVDLYATSHVAICLWVNGHEGSNNNNNNNGRLPGGSEKVKSSNDGKRPAPESSGDPHMKCCGKKFMKI